MPVIRVTIFSSPKRECISTTIACASLFWKIIVVFTILAFFIKKEDLSFKRNTYDNPTSKMMSIPSVFAKAENNQVLDFTEEKEKEWAGPYLFVFAADTQPGLIDFVNGGVGDRWEEEVRLMDEAVAAINKLQPRPRFLCLGGDIVQAPPGEPCHKEQYKAVQTSFSRLSSSIPILVVSGNHDVGNQPTGESRDVYNREFGDEYYSFWVGGVFYITIDSQYMFDDSMTPERSAAQERWLETQLTEARNNSSRHVVIFMHIPIFVNKIDEPETHHSLKIKDRVPLLERFADARVQKVFHGHYHRTAGGVWTRQNADGTESKIEVIVSSALGAQLGSDQSGINIVKVTENDITYQYYAVDRVPERVEL